MYRKFIQIIFIGITSLLSVVFFWESPFILIIILLVIAYLEFLIWEDKVNLPLFLTLGLFGAIAEIISIYFGVWEYSQSELLGIPLWLPILWGIAALYIKNLTSLIKSYYRKKK